MKKKSQVRNQRVSRMKEKMEIISKNDAIRIKSRRKAEDEIIRAEKQKEEENRKRFFAQIAEDADFGLKKGTKFKNKKTKARATGLKSVFVLSSTSALITTYGKGWKSVPEKLITKEEMIDLQDSETLEIRKEKPSYLSVSGYLSDFVYIPDPLYQSGCKINNRQKNKARLEQQFFGEEYSDNIHIQVIYNILDIEKILSVYVNHVVFAINNIIRTSGNEYSDYIGTLSLGKSFSSFRKANMKGKQYSTEKGQWFQKLITYTSRRYFGDLFVRVNEKETKEIFEERCYAYLCLIGQMRQALVHGGLGVNSQLYTLDQQFDYLHHKNTFRSDARKILFSFYSSRVDDINSNFLRLANKDLVLLNMAYRADNNAAKEQIIADYADYVIKQKYKNGGISLQKLRQSLISVYLNKLSSEEYDSVRKRLYRLINFTIYRYYANNQQDADIFIRRLRSSMSDKEKNALYVEEATRIWPSLKDPVENGIVYNIMKISRRNLARTGNTNRSTQIISPDGNCFCQLILLLSQFLDSTEANEMISYLIDKLESIQDLLLIMKSQNISAAFTAPYSIFHDSSVMAGNLREINSFSHMNSQKAYLRINLRKLYFDAARIFGYDGSDQSLEKYIQSHLINCEMV